MHVEPVRPGQLERPLEQADGGALVAAPERAPAGGREALAGALGAARRVGLPELGLVAGGLLEVVAEDLVQLDQLGAVLLEPVGEALVQLGPGRLRQRVVGGVADQQVAEAEAVLARKLRRSGRISCLRTSAASRGVTCGSSGRERLHGAAVEDLALDRAALEDAPLARRRAGRGGRRAARAASAEPRPRPVLLGHGEHLGEEERVAAGRAAIRSPQRLRTRRRAARRPPRRGSGSSRSVDRPFASALEQLRARHADEQDRRAARRAAPTPSTRSRKVSSPHWMSSKTTTSGACSSSSLRNAQAISSADVAALRLSEQRADRRRRGRVGGERVELLDHLDHRPVGDPLAVGEAAAADDPRVDRGERLGDERATCRDPRRRRS